jgi:hypothetical protein
MKLKESLSRVGRPDLVVLLGYGFELSVFSRARALWDFYISHYPNLTFFFCRTTDELAYGEVHHNGHDLLFGSHPDSRNRNPQSQNYANSGIWATHENLQQISWQLGLYEFLRRRFDHPFYVVHSTITSVVDFRGLQSLLETFPPEGCFAGMPGRITTPGTYENLTFACGTNCVFSRDVTELLTQRFDPKSPHNAIPQDVNVSWMLKDVGRIPLPFFTFSKPRDPQTDLGNVGTITRRMLDDGHYHFRVKTTSEQAGLGARGDVDPWIMFEIMRAILSHQPPPEAAVNLKARLLKSLNTASGENMSAYEDHFFDLPRDFALSDEEAEAVYPDLRMAT